jgi:hypothetical protein
MHVTFLLDISEVSLHRLQLHRHTNAGLIATRHDPMKDTLRCDPTQSEHRAQSRHVGWL